jgi:hypothetical protein
LGVLERIKIGKCSRVTVPSIRKVLLYGVPPRGERERGMIGHKGGPPLDDRLSDHNDCLRYKPSQKYLKFSDQAISLSLSVG